MFKDNGDGTITDTATGLMWQKETAGSYDWQDAMNYCWDLDLAGHTDWRLPTVRELFSIVDYGRKTPAIDPVFGTMPAWYWSFSTGVNGSSQAWSVDFGFGFVGRNWKTDDHYVRAVRGGEVNDE